LAGRPKRFCARKNPGKYFLPEKKVYVLYPYFGFESIIGIEIHIIPAAFRWDRPDYFKKPGVARIPGLLIMQKKCGEKIFAAKIRVGRSR
jgi:hypothetical protein